MLRGTAQFTPVAIAFAALATSACVPRTATVLPTRTPPTLVIVVRHAEKSAPAGDVPLSVAGEARAVALARILAGAHIAGVITTTLQRTIQTGAPTARAAGVVAIQMPPQADVARHAAQIVDLIRSRFAGRTVIVVGHSNTVGAVVHALGAATPPDLCDSEYSHVYVVESFGVDSAHVVDARYGAADPDPLTGCPSAR